MRGKRKSLLVLALLVILLTACGMLETITNNSENEIAETDIKIAAVGDSITDEYIPGANYPRILDDLLGEGYAVMNYGKSNYAAQASSDFPYTSTDAYEESLALKPDIVIIMLGTNDTKANNWNGKEIFKKEYTTLVESYKSLDSVSRVILASPPTVLTENVMRGSIDPQRVEPIREVIQEVAEEFELEFVDLSAKTANHPEWFFDGVHPTPEGAEEIAQIFYEQISNK